MSSPSIVINIFYLKINSIENASSLNIGQSLTADIMNSDKRNQGYGQNYGDQSCFSGTQGLIEDKDFMDAPAIKGSSPVTIERPVKKDE